MISSIIPIAGLGIAAAPANKPRAPTILSQECYPGASAPCQNQGG